MMNRWYGKIKPPFHLLIPLVLIAFVIITIPLELVFEFDSDEGVNLIKAILVADGLRLYQDIWSDQPPFFTFILALWLKLFGHSIFAARFLVLLFASLLVWCFYQTLRLELGVIAAAAGTLILVNSHNFVRLSGSVMIGIPALALGMLAVYTLHLGQQRASKILIFTSGVCLALSMQTKLFTLFLIPLLCLQLLYFSGAKNQVNFRSRLTNMALWLLGLGSIYCLVGLVSGSFSYEQLLQGHLESKQLGNVFGTKFFTFSYLLNHMFGQDYLFFFLALGGVVAIVTQKQKSGFLPLAWFGLACALLASHKPVWYHHYPLITIPLAWLGAYGFASILTWLGQLKTSGLQLKKNILPLLMALVSFAAVGLETHRFVGNRNKYYLKLPEQQGKLELLTLVRRYQQQTKWFFTDKPVYAFYTGLSIPPEISVLTMKRVLTGQISYGEILSFIKIYQPEQILLSRFKDEMEEYEPMRNYLEQNYFKIYENDDLGIDYYLFKPLATNTEAVVEL